MRSVEAYPDVTETVTAAFAHNLDRKKIRRGVFLSLTLLRTAGKW